MNYACYKTNKRVTFVDKFVVDDFYIYLIQILVVCKQYTQLNSKRAREGDRQAGLKIVTKDTNCCSAKQKTNKKREISKAII